MARKGGTGGQSCKIACGRACKGGKTVPAADGRETAVTAEACLGISAGVFGCVLSVQLCKVFRCRSAAKGWRAARGNGPIACDGGGSPAVKRVQRLAGCPVSWSKDDVCAKARENI